MSPLRNGPNSFFIVNLSKEALIFTFSPPERIPPKPKGLTYIPLLPIYVLAYVFSPANL
jgi:hypothetical protein